MRRSVQNAGMRNQAYPNLRDLLLEHADVLVAISDDVDGGEGGTVNVMRYALQAGLPVIVITIEPGPVVPTPEPDPDDPDRKTIKKPTGSHMQFGSDGSLPRPLFVICARVMARAGSAAHSDDRPAEPIAAMADRMQAYQMQLVRTAAARDYVGETFEKPQYSWIYKAARAAITAWPKSESRGAGFGAPGEPSVRPARHYGTSQRTARRYVAELGPPSKWTCAADRQRVRPTARSDFAKFICTVFAWADASADPVSPTTRQLLRHHRVLGRDRRTGRVARRAVLADPYSAPAKMCFWYRRRYPAPRALQFYFPAHENSWHEKMVEYRVLAELLRHQRFIYAFGAAGRLARSG